MVVVAASPSVAMTPEAFSSEIRRLAARISTATPEEAASLSVALPSDWTVEIGDDRVDVSAVWLRDRLHTARLEPATWHAARADLVQRLAAIEREASALGTASTVDPSASRASLEQVLARPEFRQLSHETAIARLRGRVAEWFRRLWLQLGGDRLGFRQTARVFAWIVSLAALGVLVAWIVRTLQRSAATGRFVVPAPISRPSAMMWARQALAATDPREAVRCFYRAAICRLEDEGVWRLDDARTPREYIRMLPREHTRRPIVSDVARRFEEVFFGGRDATDEDRAALARRLKDLGCLPAE